MVLASKVVDTAKSQLGNRESPFGSNRGRAIKKYGDVTGAYGYAWCVSFVQWVLKKHGVGPIANNTAGVFYLESYARQRGWLVSRPLPGDLVCFMKGQGHIGIVTRVRGNYFETVEGNAGNAVTRRFHTRQSYHHFVRVPGVVQTKKPTYVRVARFRLLTPKGKPVTQWKKWSKLYPDIPRKLAKNPYGLLIRRTVVRVKKG